MVKFKYFKPEEFLQATPACKISDMDETLLSMLDKAREIAGIPFVINSAYRSYEHEKKHGRSGHSAHCLGKAVDIHCISSRARFRIVSAALQVGFNRIGIYPTFIHLDVADCYNNKSTDIIWLSTNSASDPFLLQTEI